MNARLHRPGSRWPLAVAAATAALTLAACSSGTTPSATAPATATAPANAVAPATAAAPQEQTVAWTDSACGAVVPVAESLLNPPGFDLTAPGPTRDAYVAYLAKAQGATDKALQDVAAAGPAPVDGGQQVADDLRDQLTDLRDDLGDARTQLEQVDPNDANAIGRAALAAGNVIGAVGNNVQVLQALDGDPRLDAAFEQAQSCERLRSIQTPGHVRGR